MNRALGLAAVCVALVSGCAAEPVVIVVPSQDALLPDVEAISPQISDFDAEVELVSEKVVPGFFDDSLGAPIDAFYFAELTNTSATTVYHFSITGTVYDEAGQVWSDQLFTNEFMIFPGERIAIVEQAFNDNPVSIPTTVEALIEPLFARGVGQSEAGLFLASDVSFTPRSFGEYTVTGSATNPFDHTIENFASYAWCVDSNGQLHGVYPAYFFASEGDALEPGETVDLKLQGFFSERVVIEECSISLVRVAN